MAVFTISCCSTNQASQHPRTSCRPPQWPGCNPQVDVKAARAASVERRKALPPKTAAPGTLCRQGGRRSATEHGKGWETIWRVPTAATQATFTSSTTTVVVRRPGFSGLPLHVSQRTCEPTDRHRPIQVRGAAAQRRHKFGAIPNGRRQALRRRHEMRIIASRSTAYWRSSRASST